MKTKLLPYLTCMISCIMLGSAVAAQIKTKIYREEIPAALVPLKSKPGEEIRIAAPPEFTNLKKKANNNSPEIDNRFAVGVTREIDLIKSAKLTKLNGRNMYTLTIKAEGALNINCQFSEFRLPPNAFLKIFTKREITDSITEKENNEHNVWATKVYQGDELHFTLSLPEGNQKNLLLKIDKVNIGFKPYGLDFGNIGASQGCNINVVCPEGNGWEPERNSVALIVADGSEACTGALVMNTCNENIPYFLTAEHCLGAGNVPNWVFQFQTWSTSCNSNTGWIETVQFNGCQLRAANQATDFALLELNTIPAANSGIHYAGWSREIVHNSTTVIHHPRGDLMKISGDNQGPVAVTDFNGVARQCWEIDQDFGILEGGSSGAPYFNQDHRVIGTHFRRPQVGTLDPCDISIARGGRFEPSWAGGGTNATRLSNWLDPNNTGAMTTNTTNIANLINVRPDPYPPLYFISGPGEICSSADYSINAPAGATVTWNASPAGLVSFTPTSPTSVTANLLSNGDVTILATITFCSGRQVTLDRPGIEVGPPPPVEYVTVNGGMDPQQMCPGWNAFTPYPYVYTQYEWYIPGDWYSTNSNSGPNPWVCWDNQFDFVSGSPGQVAVRKVNTCGASDLLFFDAGYNCGMLYTVSPNPARGQINIDGRGSKKKIKEVQILDKLGVVKKITKYSGNIETATFNTSGLAPGLYYLKIYDGKNWNSKLLSIQ